MAAIASHLLGAQELHPAQPTSRPDVATIDHDRIIAAADRFITASIETIAAHPPPQPPASSNVFVSSLDDGTSVPGEAATPFTAHRDAMMQFTLAVPALTSAALITRASNTDRARPYAQRAAEHLRAWFVAPSTRMEPSLEFAASTANTGGHPDGILETSGLAEVAEAIPFLIRADVLSAEEISAIRAWFASFLKWLTTARLAGLGRDRKDHVGSSWLFQCAAYARLLGDDATLGELRHLFKTTVLRAQIVGDGTFPHELSTPNPYRNSLFNLDLLAAACELLSTRFENLWEYQLQDGPGLRVAIARHAPYIENRGTWPYRADAHLFNDLPCRRPALLFAARAYQRPEYATLWRSLKPDPKEPEILRTFPLRQPILWVTRSQP